MERAENIFGKNIRIYRDVIIRRTELADDVIIGDDSFVTDCVIGEKVSIERRCMMFSANVGDYTTVGWNSVIRNVNIGKFCSIAWNTSLGGAEHPKSHLTTHFFPIDENYGFWDKNDHCPHNTAYDAPVNIGNDVWIAANAQILRGVNVGDGAIIAAGAVVTHDVGPYEIWAGVPAKKIGQRFDDSIIQELVKIHWWNLPFDVIKNNINLFWNDLSHEIINKLKVLVSH